MLINCLELFNVQVLDHARHFHCLLFIFVFAVTFCGEMETFVTSALLKHYWDFSAKRLPRQVHYCWQYLISLAP